MMAQRSVNERTALLPPRIRIVGLAFVVRVESRLDRRQRRVMLAVGALAVENCLEYLMGMRTSRWCPGMIAAIFGCAARMAILAQSCRIVRPRRSHWRAWAAVALDAAIQATALISGICLRITAENHCQRAARKRTGIPASSRGSHGSLCFCSMNRGMIMAFNESNGRIAQHRHDIQSI